MLIFRKFFFRAKDIEKMTFIHKIILFIIILNNEFQIEKFQKK